MPNLAVIEIRNEHEAYISCQYLHTLVENIDQRYRRIYLEDFALLLDPRRYKRSP
jgi:hypothetical protein